MSDVAAADLYDDLAGWFHLLTAPEDAGEAAFTLAFMREHVVGPLETLLELGAGGGNLASHLTGCASPGAAWSSSPHGRVVKPLLRRP
jgi:hypothetical protein